MTAWMLGTLRAGWLRLPSRRCDDDDEGGKEGLFVGVDI